MTDPGKYRNRITFQAFDGTTDQYGDVRTDDDANWEDVKTVWACINPLSGKEFFAAEQSQSEVTHKISCRYAEGITTAMRITHKGRKFHIVSVIDWENRHKELLILAKELVR